MRNFFASKVLHRFGYIRIHGGGGWGIHDKPADCWWYSSNWFKIKFVCDPESWKLLWILEKYFSLFFEVQTTLKISRRHWGMFKLKNHITVWTEVKQLKKVWKRVVWKVGKRLENQLIDCSSYHTAILIRDLWYNVQVFHSQGYRMFFLSTCVNSNIPQHWWTGSLNIPCLTHISIRLTS